MKRKASRNIPHLYAVRVCQTIRISLVCKQRDARKKEKEKQGGSKAEKEVASRPDVYAT